MVRKKTIKKQQNIWIVFIFIVFGIFLFLNVFVSQEIPELYLSFLRGGGIKPHTDFLIAIKPLPEFNKELSLYRERYGNLTEANVFREDVERDLKIEKLEELLQKNKKQPQLLKSLSILYAEKGQNEKSRQLLEIAEKIDPLIHNQ